MLAEGEVLLRPLCLCLTGRWCRCAGDTPRRACRLHVPTERGVRDAEADRALTYRVPAPAVGTWVQIRTPHLVRLARGELSALGAVGEDTLLRWAAGRADGPEQVNCVRAALLLGARGLAAATCLWNLMRDARGPYPRVGKFITEIGSGPGPPV